MTAIFNTVQESELRAFWPTQQPIRVLARCWDCSDSYISQKAKTLGLPSRKGRVHEIREAAFLERFQGRVENYKYFEQAAERRNLTPEQLRNRILTIIINDRIVDAILDDADELRVVA